MSAYAPYQPRPRRPMREASGRRSSPAEWRWSDRFALVAAWSTGMLLCLIAAAIVVYMAVRGIQYLRPAMLVTRTNPSLSQAESGGFLDPIEGTALLTAIGLVIASPLAVFTALWVVEYGRPAWLARVVESTIEIVAGTPDIVLAVFGLALFQLPFMGVFSLEAQGGGVFGRSFISAGAILSLIALPPLFAATRDGLQAVPSHMREAAYALGKTKIATIRSVLLPSVRSNIAAGVTLGTARIIGDTAIIVVLVNTYRIETASGGPLLSLLKGSGPTLTSFVYENSPAGEGGAPQKAYAAAFVLMVLVFALNVLVGRFGRSNADETGMTIAGAVV